MNGNIKFNVIVPTRERADTLYHCLRTIVTQDYENFNVIVSDNFSQDKTQEVVHSFGDPRIQYVNTGKRISMSHNWEYALGHVTDGWVTFMGDDDGLFPGGLSTVAKVIQKTGCQAVSSRGCVYHWPSSTLAQNILTVPLTSGIELRNGGEWLDKLMRGQANYFDLPWLYTGGFVDHAVIHRARGSSGAFFFSMIPDVYAAIALASILDRYVMLNEPVSVMGVSSHSMGASQLGTETSPTPAKKFFSEENIPFHSLVAGGETVKSVAILIYESYLQSTHLHKDFLKVRLEDQLGLSLALVELEDLPRLALGGVPQRKYADLRKYCSEIASWNGLSFDLIDQKRREAKKRLFLPKLKERVSRIFSEFVVSPNAFGVEDIQSAAFLAKAIYVLNTRHAHWRMGNIMHIYKKILRRLYSPSKAGVAI